VVFGLLVTRWSWSAWDLGGDKRELFASDAVAMLHEAAAGSLRDIDRLATAALKETVRRKKKLVERDTLARVIDLDRGTGG